MPLTLESVTAALQAGKAAPGSAAAATSSSTRAAAAEALALALDIPYKVSTGVMGDKTLEMSPRHEIMLELYFDALDVCAHLSLSPPKTLTFLQIQRTLLAALQASFKASASSIGRASSPLPLSRGGDTPDDFISISSPSGGGSPSLSHNMRRVPSLGMALPLKHAGSSGAAIHTAEEAAALYERCVTDACVPELTAAADGALFSVEEVAALSRYMTDSGFLRHFKLYRHVLSQDGRSHVVHVVREVLSPLPVPPLPAGEPATAAGAS